MTPERFERAVREILDNVPAMTLATVGDGLPWATDVYFAPMDWRLVFFSSPKSRHCRNLAGKPNCAATVHPQVASWREIRGVQMEGVVLPADGVAGQARATAAYLAKFPFVRDLLANPVETARKMTRVSPHVFTPSRVRYLDNTLGFGARFVMRFQDGRPTGQPEREDSRD